jgi:hypothetical protein
VSFVNIIQCDVCENKKGEGNRWLLGWPSYGPNSEACGYALSDWNARESTAPGVNHFCGEKCAFVYLSNQLRSERVVLPF